jgi:hypothetical protein
MSPSGCNLERLSFLALLGYVHQLTGLHSERWSVNALSIHENVAVNYQLA